MFAFSLLHCFPLCAFAFSCCCCCVLLNSTNFLFFVYFSCCAFSFSTIFFGWFRSFVSCAAVHVTCKPNEKTSLESEKETHRAKPRCSVSEQYSFFTRHFRLVLNYACKEEKITRKKTTATTVSHTKRFSIYVFICIHICIPDVRLDYYIIRLYDCNHNQNV